MVQVFHKRKKQCIFGEIRPNWRRALDIKIIPILLMILKTRISDRPHFVDGGCKGTRTKYNNQLVKIEKGSLREASTFLISLYVRYLVLNLDLRGAANIGSVSIRQAH